MKPAMTDRGGRVVRDGGKLAAGVGVALAGLVLTVAGCSRVLPLGPGPAAAPAPRHLASPIVMEPGLSQPGASASRCPAGSVALSGPGALPAAPVGANPGSPVTSPSTPVGVCFRRLGKPVRFTSAGVVLYEQPAGSEPVQHPASWGVSINLPAAEASALKAVTTKLAGTQEQLAIIIAGQTWAMPVTMQPLTKGEFVITAQSRSQALQLQRSLLEPA
jgi:hypothetical protein